MPRDWDGDWGAAGWDVNPGERPKADEPPTLLQIWWPILIVGGTGTLVAITAVFVPFFLLARAMSGWDFFPSGSPDACEDPDEELWLAATDGDLPTIERELLELGGTNGGVDASHDGWTPLLCAIEHRRDDAAQMLLDAGADPDLGVDGGSSPLAIAAEDGDVGIIRALLGAGADPNNSLGGTTALHQAAENERVGAIEVLADGGADLEAVNKEGATPLVLAARNRPRTVEALLDAAADPNTVCEIDGNEVGSVTIALALITYEPGQTPPEPEPIQQLAPLHQGRGPVTALHAAALTGDEESVRLLLQAGADPNAVAYGSYTPLHASAAVGAIDAALAAFAEQEDWSTWRPTSENDERVTALLLLGGADPNLAPNPTVGTPADLAEALIGSA